MQDLPIEARLLSAADKCAMLGDPDARRLDPSLVHGAPALMDMLPGLLIEAAGALQGKQMLLRELMEVYSAAGGDGIATAGAIMDAIRIGADPKTKDAIAAAKALADEPEAMPYCEYGYVRCGKCRARLAIYEWCDDCRDPRED